MRLSPPEPIVQYLFMDFAQAAAALLFGPISSLFMIYEHLRSNRF